MEGQEESAHLVIENGNAVNPEFIETLRSLGVAEEDIEIPEDILCEPVEILVNFAKGGSINPWDIDIVQVTDKFLEKIEEMKMMDLRISGRTLLYAAILLRMKSTGIVQEEEDELEEPLDDDLDFQDVDDYPVPSLPVRRSATRPVTLQELINELKKAERVETKRTERRRKNAERQAEIPSTDDVLEIAHEEDIKGRSESLQEMIEEMLQGKECITFSEVTEQLPERSERIMTYLSLLFLAADKGVCLCQKELFGELYIYPRNGMSALTEGVNEVNE
ncbi:segregation and condensation protein A [Methanohalophilus levihalophilus]|uniref:segregation and condensation protein A n=1 Tax=Methanohalophilus levihalophilus TaxID=1431282 RepID=UPI001AE45221|nr:ScpA family protein [Methanohalophilus levihalophilus]MBP2030717.1 segregation and condensation protein A [Methanohalophilus levihalophilus]